MKRFLKLIMLMLVLFVAASCGKNDAEKNSQNEDSANIPQFTISWGNELHTGIMYLPLEKAEEFKEKGVYLNPLSEDQFELIKEGKKLALFNFVPTKGGSEAATLMGQKHLDAAVCSNTAMLSAVDQGTAVKILAPIQTDGVALVFPAGTDFYGWDAVKKHIQDSEVPVKIGYHSPVSGPRIALESVLKEEGLKVTEDPGDSNADVLLVDLKGSSNLLPSLTSGQVDAWVGPSHYPEAAEVEGLGKIVLTLNDFPPEGKWENFPCCVFSAREEVVNQNPEVFEAMVELIDETTKYAMENKEESSKILSEKIGVSKEAVDACKITYTTNPTEKWMSGIKIYADSLQAMGKFTGNLKDKSFDEIKNLVFDFEYANKINNN